MPPIHKKGSKAKKTFNAWFNESLSCAKLRRAAELVGVQHFGLTKAELVHAVRHMAKFNKLRKAHVEPPPPPPTLTVLREDGSTFELKHEPSQPMWKFLLDVACRCNGEAVPVTESDYEWAQKRVNAHMYKGVPRLQLFGLLDEDGTSVGYGCSVLVNDSGENELEQGPVTVGGPWGSLFPGKTYTATKAKTFPPRGV